MALFAWVLQGLIVLSGAAVRLTEAGLGCEDWPTCNEGELLPEWQVHGLIEFGNRVISLFVTLSTVAVVIAAYRLRPRRRDLMPFAWALAIGTVAQIVLGGITVLLDLHPMVVGLHFLFSMALLWAAQSLWLRAGHNPADDHQLARSINAVDDRTRLLTKAQLGLSSLVLVAGTVVTGTGPHSGDSSADRFSFELTSVTRVHSTTVWILLAVLVFFAIHLARAVEAGQAELGPGFTAVRWMLVAAVAQGALGYTQFALGVPAALVEAHIFGALVVWTLSGFVYRRILGFQLADQDERLSV